MKSAVFYGKHDIKVEESPMPQLGEHDVLIKVMACGVCGTDVHIYEGDKGAADTTPPTILGHEFAGLVEQVGPGVRSASAIFASTWWASAPRSTAALPSTAR